MYHLGPEQRGEEKCAPVLGVVKIEGRHQRDIGLGDHGPDDVDSGLGASRRWRQGAVVTYDGRMMPLSVRAIVAVPDRQVKRISADGIPMVNPRQFAALFQLIQPHPLSEEMIRNIVRRIE